MARIETYTANLAAARGQRGQVQSTIDGSAVQPSIAGERLGATMQQAGAQLAAIADQKQREKEVKWVSDSNDQLSRVLIDWQNKNKDRTDFGEAFRAFADEQVDKYATAAPNSRARDAFKMHVMPSINRDWEGALHRGEQNRFAAFDASETKASETINTSFRARLDYGEPEAARDSLTHDLAMQKERIDTFYKGAPVKAAAMKERATVGAILGVIDSDPTFAKELLDSSKDIDAESRSALLSRISTAQHRTDSMELTKAQLSIRETLADAKNNNRVVVMPDLSPLKQLMSPPEFLRYETQVKQEFERHNVVTKAVQDYAPLHPALRRQELAKEAGKHSGTTGLAIKGDLIDANAALDKELKADSMAFVTKYNPDVQAAYQAWKKSGKPEDEDYWRTLAWNRLGHAPAPLDAELKAGLRPEALKAREATAKTYQDIPQVERRFIFKEEATHYADLLTKGSESERLQAVQQINARFPDEYKRAVVFKDIEQLSDGKGPELQRTLVASKLAEVNPSAAGFLLSGKGREAFKGLKPEAQKEIRDSLTISAPTGKPSWSLFAMAARGADSQSQDLVDGFRSAVEEMAALNYVESLGQGRKTTDAVDRALKALIFDRVAMPVMTDSLGEASGQALLISRTKINPKTNQPDRSLGTRTDQDIEAIRARIPYTKEVIKWDDIELAGSNGRPYFSTIAPYLYQNGTEKQVKGSQDLLQRHILQRGFWISDPDSQGATFYLPDETGTSFAPQFKMTKEPLRILYEHLPMTDERRMKGTERDIYKGTETPPSSY
jgi:gas vesicle protein